MGSEAVYDDASQGVRALLHAATSARATWVRFLETGGRGELSRLEVEWIGADVPVDEIRRALHDLRVQIVGVTTLAPGTRTQRMRVVDFDGGALSRRRRREVCDGLAARLSFGLVGPGIASAHERD